jgi:hypothetical protein
MDEDFEYCGECTVCNEPVDLSDMGNCSECGSVFHWGDCGTWNNGQHMCQNCIQDKCDHDWEDIGNGKKQCTYEECQKIKDE